MALKVYSVNFTQYKDRGFPGGSSVCLPMQETQVWTLGWKEPLEEEMATHSSILAWKIPWTEEAGGLQPMGSKRVGHNLVAEHSTLP